MNTSPSKNTINNPTPSSQKQAAYIQYHSLLLLVSSMNKVIYVFPLTASILTFLFWSHVNHIILISWLSSVYILSVLRYVVHKKIAHEKNSTINYPLCLNYMLVLDVIGGLLVGLSSLFLGSLPFELQGVLIVVSVTITMESVAGQSAIKSSYIAFTVPLFISFIMGLLLIGSNTFYILSILAVLHFFLLYGNFTAMHHHIKSNLTLTYSNQQLAKQLEQKNQDLVKSNELVNVTSQAKSKFIISMGQTLKFPLQGMLNQLENTQKQTNDAMLSNALTMVRSSGVNLLNLLNDLKDVYRFEQGDLQPKAEAFDVRQHFENLAQLMAMNAHVKGLKFYCTINSNVPAKIESDPVRLSQITLNLVANAIKFTTQGQVELRISSTMHGKQMCLNISVSDTGKGINEEDLAIIYQPFVQGKSDIQTIGNGLGLSISRELIQILGGEILVSSILGKGSIFNCDIPVLMTQKTELTAVKNEKSILLVIDEPQQQMSIEQQLLFLNLSYDIVTNAKKAMIICAENRSNFSAVFIGHQSKLEHKLFINLCQRLKLPAINLVDFGVENNNDFLTLNYPVKTAKLKATLSKI